MFQEQDDPALEIGDRGDLVLIRALAEAVEGIAGVEFGALGEVDEMVDGHKLALVRRGCRHRRRRSLDALC